MDALAFLEKNGHTRRQPYYVLSGDDDFLKRRVLAILPGMVIGDADPEYALSNFPGDKTDFSTVRNELDSVSFFSERRLVIIEQADPFVTKFRSQLEQYVTQPAEKGVLVLDVKSFPATTKLAKQVPEACHIICKSPPEYKLPAWCTDWALSQYGKKLPPAAAQMLVHLVGSQLGVLDQELQKLCDSLGDKPTIEARDVDEFVGRSRSADVFKIMEAIGNNKLPLALTTLAELWEESQEPIKILGALAYQLRKLARVAAVHKRKIPLDEAMDLCNVPKYPVARDNLRKQMKYLGWGRLDKLFDWLLEIDNGLKGGSPLPERLQMERLLIRLGRSG